jgi:hypothetical protein
VDGSSALRVYKHVISLENQTSCKTKICKIEPQEDGDMNYADAKQARFDICALVPYIRRLHQAQQTLGNTKNAVEMH